MLKITNSDDQDTRSFSNIFSIPSQCDFLQVLVASLLDGSLIKDFCPKDNPLLLSSVTIFVPNRRAGRALSTAFLSAFDEEALLLPDIRTLGDVGDEAFGVSPDSSHFGQPGEEIKPLERTLLLAKLVQSWVDAMEEETRRIYQDEEILIPSSSADSILLAQDLSILLSQITQEEIEWSAIQNIVPDNHAEWWKLTTAFLTIIMENWPAHLKKNNLLDPAERAAKLLELRTEFYQTKRNKGPVIVAGSTGSVASTRRLLAAVASLEDGAVVLPGLDKTLPQNEWQTLLEAKKQDLATLETHPQFGLATLLKSLGVERDNVGELGTTTQLGNHAQRILGMALVPSDFTSKWATQGKVLKSTQTHQALSRFTLIEATNERQEALAIAVAMREVLNRQGQTAALVTPDRNLARRVSMELQRYNIIVDDTGGTPLKNSQAALFLRQITQICFLDFQNSALAALLKNPLSLAGLSFGKARKLSRQFELVALRGVINQPQPGQFASFISRCKERIAEAKYISAPVKRIEDDDWSELINYAEQLDVIFRPLMVLSKTDDDLSLQELFRVLANAAEALSRDENGISQLLNGEGAKELKHLFEDVLSIEQNVFAIKSDDFPTVLDAILSSAVTRPRGNTHPRLHIYGPLEVRMLEHDRIILAGLNEGTWPQTTRNDPFLNRAMRQELGMASPERRTGLSAHDFQQLMGKQDVFISRSARVNKSPTVASRWIQRLLALIGEEETNTLRKRGAVYLQYGEHLDKSAEPVKRIKCPNPKPPVEARPTSLAVTDIEAWIRDPYALYAKRILKLQPLAPLERDADPPLKGTLYHAIMQDYIESVDLAKPADERKAYLNALAQEHIKDENLPEEISNIWTLRFHEISDAYIAWENTYLEEHKVNEMLCEIDGSIKLVEGSFHLRARADRIDVMQDNALHIIDYKTGSNPTVRQAQTLSPQLALEGLIARMGGFAIPGKADVGDLSYMRLRSKDDFKNEHIHNKNNLLNDIINNAEQELLKLIKGYQLSEQGYISRRAPFKDGDISGDYDHLARTREWSFGADDEGDES